MLALKRAEKEKFVEDIIISETVQVTHHVSQFIDMNSCVSLLGSLALSNMKFLYGSSFFYFLNDRYIT
jgi:hypothetical protein